METINWELFKISYLRPLMNDIDSESYDENSLQSYTYTTISDLIGKGLNSFGPAPSSTTNPGQPQINLVAVGNNVQEGNVFYIEIEGTQISYTAGTNATVSSVVNGLVQAITNEAAITKTAEAQTARLKITGDDNTEFRISSSAISGSGTNIPNLETTRAQDPKASTQSITAITQVEALTIPAFSVIAYGVRYFAVSEPITRVNTTAGLNITKDKDLVRDAKSDYYQAILAFIEANDIDTPTANYWKTRLGSAVQTENANNDLTFEQRLALLNAEYDRKIEQDDNTYLDTGINDRLLEDERLNHEKILRELNRTYELKDRNNLEQKNATNGAWTPAGQFTQTFVSEYFTPLEDTVQKDTMNITNDYLGLTDLVNSGVVLTSNRINVSEFDLLELDLQATEAVEYTFYSSQDGSIFTQVSNSTISSNITKKYHLPPSKYIKIGIKGLSNNTYFYIEASLRK